ncbi:alpha/beta hydrolase [Rhodococcus sp. USK13]|uniref:alpha/beta fold hydrolase n=1 Tax=Rhodococcus sp. USK13 TaxID=2806442 RepID=UPI0032D59431
MDDPTIVFLHGGGQTRHSWDVSATRLCSDSWSTLNVDLRGHGSSRWSASRSYGLDHFAADIDAIVDSLTSPPVLVGASLGGAAALASLGQRPLSARGLVLVDVSPFVQSSGADRIRDFMTSHAGGFASLDEAADAVAAYLPHRPRPRNSEGLRKNLRQRGNRWHWHWDPAFLSSAFDQPVHRDRLIDPARLGAAAATLRIPTMLIRGGKSDVLDREDVRRFLRVVPHTEYVEIADAHHMVAGDDNSVFDTVLSDFLQRRIHR